MLVVHPELVRGASHGGATFHDQGGPYGRRMGAEHTIAVDCIGCDEPRFDNTGRRVFRFVPYAGGARPRTPFVGRHRRLAKSFENTVGSATSCVQVSYAALLL
ncbi:MAG: hypothetical protein M5U19_01185 [Microthrixaceae bacterium]|nr:hypothetical protein [Microthrixaceae bacterium]